MEQQYRIPKAVLVDEWNGENTISNFLGAEVCWVVPCVTHQTKMMNGNTMKELQDFNSTRLTLNLRNCKEVVKTAKTVAEENVFKHANHILEPPKNFPNGIPTEQLNSINEALFRTRLKTSKGILIITDRIEQMPKSFQNENMYYFSGKNFAYLNPNCILHDGNILATLPKLAIGFEWPTLICDMGENKLETHKCNMLMRCTTMLYIVGGKTLLPKDNFPYIEILHLLESPVDGEPSFSTELKSKLKKYTSDHLEKFNRREWLNEVFPILEKTIDEISKVLNSTEDSTYKKIFPIMENLLRTLIEDLYKNGFINTSMVSVIKDIIMSSISFIKDKTISNNDPHEILRYIDLDLLQEIISTISNLQDLSQALNISTSEKQAVWEYYKKVC